MALPVYPAMTCTPWARTASTTRIATYHRTPTRQSSSHSCQVTCAPVLAHRMVFATLGAAKAATRIEKPGRTAGSPRAPPLPPFGSVALTPSQPSEARASAPRADLGPLGAKRRPPDVLAVDAQELVRRSHGRRLISASSAPATPGHEPGGRSRTHRASDGAHMQSAFQPGREPLKRKREPAALWRRPVRGTAAPARAGLPPRRNAGQAREIPRPAGNPLGWASLLRLFAGWPRSCQTLRGGSVCLAQ